MLNFSSSLLYKTIIDTKKMYIGTYLLFDLRWQLYNSGRNDNCNKYSWFNFYCNRERYKVYCNRESYNVYYRERYNVDCNRESYNNDRQRYNRARWLYNIQVYTTITHCIGSTLTDPMLSITYTDYIIQYLIHIRRILVMIAT